MQVILLEATEIKLGSSMVRSVIYDVVLVSIGLGILIV